MLIEVRPPLKEAMKRVLGDRVMGVDQVLAELKERQWMPTCRDERTYVRYALATFKGSFERVGPGAYRVRRV